MAITRRALRKQTDAVLLCVLVLTFLLFAAPASQAVPLWTSGGIEIYGTGQTYGAEVVSIIPDGSGGSIVVWVDMRNSRYDVFAQKVDQDGVCQWAENGVDVRGPGMTSGAVSAEHAVVSDGAGGAIIAWIDRRSGGPTVYVQRLNQHGELQWTTNGVEVHAPVDWYSSRQPVIASDGAGGAIVAWYEYDNLEWHAEYAIFAQRVNSSGERLWSANGVQVRGLGPFGSATLSKLSIVADGDGGVIIAWDDFGAGRDIYAQRFNAGGTALWKAGGLEVCAVDVACISPLAASDGAGGAIITWWERYPDGYEVFAQRVTSGGQCLWTSSGVNVRGMSYPGGAGSPSITTDGRGGAIIAWADARNTTGASVECEIYVQRLDAAGTALWTPGGVLLTPEGPDLYGRPRITSDGLCGAIIAWQGPMETYAYPSQIIRAQKVSPSGSPEWVANGDIVRGKEFAGYATDEVIASDEHGGAILAWRDSRSGKVDVYAQRVVNPTPSVTSIAPAAASNLWAVDTSIVGNNFSEGASVRIMRGSTVIEATGVTVVSATSISCNINISGQPLGKYDVVVTNPDGQEARLVGGFSVTDACGQGAVASVSVFAATLGLMSVMGIGLRRRRKGT